MFSSILLELSSKIQQYLSGDNTTNFILNSNPELYPDIDLPLVNPHAFIHTSLYIITLSVLQHLNPFLGSHRLLASFFQLLVQTLPTFLHLIQFNLSGLQALVYNSMPIWARPYTFSMNTFSLSLVLLPPF